MNLLLKYLDCEKWTINSVLGSSTKFKQVLVNQKRENYTLQLRFIDAMNLAGTGTLRDFAASFGTEGAQEKGFFPYEAISLDNYKEVLAKSEPFKQEHFYSYLNQKGMNDEDYKIYLEDAKNFRTRWDYLQHYNELDTQIMINPIDNIIQLNWERKVDCLRNLSLSSNASQIKYAECYHDFDISKDYSEETHDPTFNFNFSFFKSKITSYKKQDEKAKRDGKENIKESDYKDVLKMYLSNPRCYLCNSRFTAKNKPTFDRIDCSKPHTKANIKFCCEFCNKFRGNRDADEMRLLIQLRKFCLKNNLPMTMSNEEAIKIIRKNITGGLSNVHHRVNIKGQTHINKLLYLGDGEIVSYDTPYIMTHVCGTDFNSLYPSSFSSEYNENNPYTGGIMYMPARLTDFIEVNKNNYNYVYNIITSKERFTEQGRLFIAEVKGHIDDKYINEFVNFPPIFRNIEITTDSATVGDYTYNYLVDNGFQHDVKEKKLTQLLKVEEFTAFSSYYLWFLIDRCHFIIDDVKSICLFTKHKRFNKFVKDFTNERIKAKLENNKGREAFCKTCLNGSYGYDGKNTMKYNKNVLKDKNQVYISQLMNNFLDVRKINDDKYIITYNPKTYSEETCLHVSFFTLDNSKFWYLNFYYNFLVRCLDTDRFHVVELDTDSLYLAIAGDPTKDYHQRFDYIIKDKEFYDKNVFKWLPNPEKDIYDEKKLLGCAIEKEGENCVALCPKCYTIWNDDGQTKSLKLKGVSLKKNDIKSSDYEKALTHPKSGKNINLQYKNNEMVKLTINKNALSGCHSKMFVLPNQCCAPLKFKQYYVLD